MQSSLQKLTEEKNKIIKISFCNLYGFHLINDSKGKHYMYLNKDDRIEEKLTHLSKFKDKFVITRGMTKDNEQKAYIQFKCNEQTFDIIEKFLLKFILSTVDMADITKCKYSIQLNSLQLNMKPVIKTEKKNYKKWIKNHRNGYAPL